jgi:GAF domain-containing protein
MVANALADDRFHDGIDRQTGFTTRSILAVPLLVNGECLGVIESVNKINGNFNEHDLNLLVILSHIFAGVMGDILSRRMGC